MQEKHHNSFLLSLPPKVQSVNIFLSSEDIEWLQSATSSSTSSVFSNLDIFNDMLSQMQTGETNPTMHVRKLLTYPGQTQVSETQLAEQFGVSRKKVHRILTDMVERGLIELMGSNSASVITFICIEGWTDSDGHGHCNPYYREVSFRGQGSESF